MNGHVNAHMSEVNDHPGEKSMHEATEEARTTGSMPSLVDEPMSEPTAPEGLTK